MDGSRSALSVRRSTMVRVRTRSCPGRDCWSRSSDGPPRRETPPPDDSYEEKILDIDVVDDAGLLPRIRVLGHLFASPAGRP